MRRFAIAVLLVVSGCDLYFNDGDDAPCKEWATPQEGDIAALLYRNPDTGVCQDFGGPYPCDGRCGPCPEYDTTAPQPVPDWGSCYSECESMSESQCMAAPGCFAAYTEFPTQDQAAQFRGCWQTAPSGPVAGSCQNLGAQECSRHDNCTAHYVDNFVRTSQALTSEFLFCAAEHPTSCTATTCGPGTHCEEQCTGGNCQPLCVPDSNTCAQIDCGPGYECVEVCTDANGGNCGTCGAQCVPSTSCEALATENACGARADCVSVYKGEDCTCYPGYCECNILTYERCETK